MRNKKIKLFLVDDDELYLRLLELEFKQFAEYEVETYCTGELCLEHLSNNPDIVILDYQLDGVEKTAMNGIQTLDKIKAYNPEIPVVMLSQQDKIEVAVDCMHHLALDYVVKSETAFLRLQKIIKVLSKYSKMERELNWYMERM